MATTKKRGARSKLSEYRKKRDFTQTAEPEGESAPTPGRRALRFVIQKHAASHLHFDLRLELDGVMKSWAVPKGPNYDPSVRRLAMEVEDHPIEYNTFEGTIPQGEYGGGTVMIWDRGTYAAEDGGGTESLRKGFARGDLKFVMHGERMRGGWVLVRTRTDDRGRSQWLLIKHRDEFARPGYDVVEEEDTSATTGRTMDQISRGRRQWTSASKPAKKAAAKKTAAKKRGSKTAASKKTAKTARKSVKKRAKRARLSGDGAPELLLEIEHDRGDGMLELPDGQTLAVTNLDKVFYPEAGFTKGDLMRYYARVSPLLLPTMADRPLVLKRYPNGVKGKAFYQQKPAGSVPDGVRVETLGAFEKNEPRIIGGDLLTLLYTIQLGAISVDPWHSRAGSLEFADYTIIDLDPGDEADFATVVEVAQHVHEVLETFALKAAIKTSGATGLHIAVPLPPGTPNDAATIVAQIVATHVSNTHPDIATIERSVRARPSGTVYVDYLQNILGKTVAGVYSARATAEATVSTPLAWDELTDTLDPRDFTIETAIERFEDLGDLWGPVMKRANSLEKLLARQ